jgi:hypothetical protein
MEFAGVEIPFANLLLESISVRCGEGSRMRIAIGIVLTG